jgi:hypothetical protein
VRKKNSSFVGPFGLELSLDGVVATLEILKLSLELLVLSHESFHVGVAWSAHGLLDIFIHVSWLFWLLVKSDKDLGELVDDSSLFEVFSELFFFLLGCLN